MGYYRRIDTRLWSNPKFQKIWIERWESPVRTSRDRPMLPGCKHFVSRCDCHPPDGVRIDYERRLLCFQRRREFNNLKKEILRVVILSLGRRCLGCRRHWATTADHVLPLTLGGTNDPENFQPLCRSCNSKKGQDLPTPP